MKDKINLFIFQSGKVFFLSKQNILIPQNGIFHYIDQI